ncbi:MAG: GtrA family protein [Oscillospiraceae bacterium]|nr:GtrA family protein [Oscillospiraceae bacterium]
MKKTIKNFIKYADAKVDFKKFIKFVITGFINTGVDWLSFAVLREAIKLYAPAAQAAAQGIAVCGSYIINKNWTFKSNKKYNKTEILKFFIVQGASLVLGYLGMFILHNKLGLNEYLCKVIIMPITVIINYFGNKLFVFK